MSPKVRKRPRYEAVCLPLNHLPFRRREQEPHVDVIAKPEGQADVPAVPEVADVPGEERLVEVLGRADPEQAAEPDGERAVAGEIEEQVEPCRRTCSRRMRAEADRVSTRSIQYVLMSAAMMNL